MKTGFPEFFKAIRALCFPPVCLACKAPLPAMLDFLFCEECAKKIEPVNEPLCTCCGRSFPFAAGGNHLCSYCLTHTRHFSQARALVLYQDPIRQAILSLKYSGKTVALATFNQLFMHHPLSRQLTIPDLILPVPLHAKRLRERGFNQALFLAQAFFPEHKNLIYPDLLVRTRPTVSQTGLSGTDRRRNVRKAFLVRDPEKVKEKTVLLVDDVFTTGTTVNECAQTLKKAGCREVQVLTLARVKEFD